MKGKHLFIMLVLLGAMLLASCSPKASPGLAVPAGAHASELGALEQCEYQPTGSNTKYIAECATMVVPENWDKADSRLIALPVVRIHASGPSPEEPVFWMQGGPGGPNLVWDPPAWVLEKHDVVMVGYRGAEGSEVFRCPEVSHLYKAHAGKDLFSDQARAEYIAATKRCAETYQEAGVDMSGYSIPGVVEDMEVVRIAMGYPKIDVLSESYGTRIAQIYAYMHPISLHRLVLIGVNTPGHFIYKPAATDEMVKYLSNLCAQDATCSSRTSDFAQTMYTVNHNMPKRWLVFNIDPGTVRFTTHMMFFSNPNMAMIIDAYLAAAEGDPSGLAMMNLIMSIVMPSDQMILGDMLNKGAADVEKYGGIDSISLGDSIMGAPHSELIWPLFESWPIKLIPKELREFQESDVEMLLVNGTVDFSTPPTALDEARPYFHKAQMVLLPEFSHVDDFYKLQPQAFERLITSYFDSGVADDSLYVYEPLSFKPKMSLPMVGKVLAAAMVLVPALLILGVVLVVRRIRISRIPKKLNRDLTN